MGEQMSSSEEYREYVLELLSGLEEVSYRKMMGEYVLYYRSKVVGGIYDDRFLLKVTPASERLLPDAPRTIPYEGAKEMLLVEVEDRDALRDIVDAMWEEVPAPKKRK
ncbi:TfoX/Sxy family protein [Schaalia dentiphila]|jgi:Regulator of competence-specific genes|uniref:TfoX N-terminal domain protein n=1 Tax=Schaalia dentiphila ATCC 17982 TaxID=411466 RepID=A7B8S8_9ACTO|nr:TfoX N-terminal domain protein [Schaalia odontolytica ATCC 17982]